MVRQAADKHHLGLQGLVQFPPSGVEKTGDLPHVPNKDILCDRIAGRRVCKACGATYNINTKPTAKEGVCDACGGEVYQRADDNRETVENRINVYGSQTAPLVEYEKAGSLVTINGDQAMDSVFSDITKVLGE